MIRSKQAEQEVNGVSTQILCSDFCSHIFILLTQVSKIGTLVLLTQENPDLCTPTFHTKVLLGQDQPLVHVCAKNLVAFVCEEAGNRPVLLGVSLRDPSLDSLQQIKDLIKTCKVW